MFVFKTAANIGLIGHKRIDSVAIQVAWPYMAAWRCMYAMNSHE